MKPWFSLVVTTCLVGSARLGHAGATTADDFRLAVSNLEAAVAEADLQKVLPDLAKFLKLELAVVEQALVEQKLTLSGLALAQLIADKTEKKLAEVIEAHPKRDWLAACQQAKVPLAEAVQRLDQLCSKVSFLTYDQQKKRKKRK
jgi:hypothetical protein